MFTDETFFVGDIPIPNITNAMVLDNLLWFVSKYEEEYLRQILGNDLYNKVVSGTVDSDIQKIINGTDFVDQYGVSQNWIGFKNEKNLSPIANYIWYNYMQANATQVTGVASANMNVNGGNSVSPAQKMATSWSFTRKHSLILLSFLWSSKDTYTDFNYEICKKAVNFFKPVSVIL